MAATSLGPGVLDRIRQSPHHVRNICILAHVDHGKTTLSDSLIAANGIISSKMAGQLRYMDSTPEEQRRGITMKSSAIALLHHDRPRRGVRQALKARGGPLPEKVPYLINLIDSPGHVDFSSDVSTAVRLCDGAIVVVDVIEGVCIQTHAVLRAAWEEGVKPVLVLNKIDRLITEARLTPLEAYERLQRILEQMNVICSALFTADLMRGDEDEDDDDDEKEAGSAGAAAGAGGDDDAAGGILDFDQAGEGSIFFDPLKGNVLFASAVDGWAFTLSPWIDLMSESTGLPKKLLRRTLWGNFAFKPKQGKVVRLGGKVKGAPMGAELVLASVWRVYRDVLLERSDKREAKIIKKLGLLGRLPRREMASKEPKQRLRTVMRTWMPAPQAILGAIVRDLPCPKEAAPHRLNRLMPPLRSVLAGVPRGPLRQEMRGQLERVYEAVRDCDNAEDAPCVAYVGRMTAVPLTELPTEEAFVAGDVDRPARVRPTRVGQLAGSELLPAELRTADPNSELSGPVASRGRALDALVGAWSDPAAAASSQASPDRQLEDRSGEALLGFIRVFAGVLRPDSPLFVLGPRYRPGRPADDDGAHISQLDAPLELYLMMSKDLAPLRSVPAGSVCAARGLGAHVLKSASLSTCAACPTLLGLRFQTTPLVQVTVEPKQVADLKRLEIGLRLLNQADPCVQVRFGDSGAFHLSALGELHLERCIADLRTRFAGVEVAVSDPIVSFKETIVGPTGSRLTAEDRSALSGQALESAAAAAAEEVAGGGGGDRASVGSGAGARRAPAFQPGVRLVSEGRLVAGTTIDGRCTVLVRARPLHAAAARLLQRRANALGEELQAAEAGRTGVPAVALLEAEAGGERTPGAEEPAEADADGQQLQQEEEQPEQDCELPPVAAEVQAQLLALAAWPVATEDDGAAQWDEDETARVQAAAAAAAEAPLSSSMAELIRNAWSFGPGVAGPNVLAPGAPLQRRASPAAGAAAATSTDHAELVRQLPPGSVSVAQLLSGDVSDETPDLAEVAQSMAPVLADIFPSVWDSLRLSQSEESQRVPVVRVPGAAAAGHAVRRLCRDLPTVRGAVAEGFRMAVAAGPLCEEPAWGVALEVVDLVLHRCLDGPDGAGPGSISPSRGGGGGGGAPGMSLSGQVMSVAGEACKLALSASAGRLVETVLRCQLQCSSGRGGGGEMLGALYGVLSQRRGRVLGEQLLEGTDAFLVDCVLPVAEATGFAEALRKRTSGAATSPQLAFSHWEVLADDPQFQPRTAEEKEEFGDTIHDGQNVSAARRLLIAVRRRKGLVRDRKIVVHAEKQRTLTKMK